MTAQNSSDAMAEKYQLPAWLVVAVIATESGGNPFAFRFEPAFLERYLPPQVKLKSFGASDHTERMARATSWGLMQIMGQVAREYGYQGEYLSSLCDPETGLEYGCRHLAHYRDRHFAALGWPGVIAAYNAGTPRTTPEGAFVNQQYVDKVMKHQPQQKRN